MLSVAFYCANARREPTISLPSTGSKVTSAVPILLPHLKSFYDHPLHQGLIQPKQRFCSPTSVLISKLPKKPKMQAKEDVFPTDWSPPPIKFLNPWAPLVNRGGPALGDPPRGAVGPQVLRRLPHQWLKKSAPEQHVSDPKRGLHSLEELLLNLVSPN